MVATRDIAKKSAPRHERRTRQPKTAVLPYLLLSILLFGRMRWVVRDGTGWVRSSTKMMCPYLRTQPDHLKGCLKSLENWGLIKRFHWYRTYFEVEYEIPVGMEIIVRAKKIRASEEAPEMFSAIKRDVDIEDTEMAGYDQDKEEEGSDG